MRRVFAIVSPKRPRDASSGCNSRAHNAGVNVNDTNVEIAVDTAIVIAN